MPPDAVIVTVAVPPKHVIADVTDADAVIAAGCGMSMAPVTGLQLLASVMLHIYPVPAVTPLNIPVVFVTPLKVYDNGAVPPPPVSVTIPVPPKHFTGDVKLFEIALEGGQRLGHEPGQFIMVSIFGAGEIPISVSSSPTTDGSFEICVRAAGKVTKSLH